MSILAALDTLTIEMAEAGLGMCDVTIALTPDDFRRACWLALGDWVQGDVAKLEIRLTGGLVTLAPWEPGGRE